MNIEIAVFSKKGFLASFHVKVFCESGSSHDLVLNALGYPTTGYSCFMTSLQKMYSIMIGQLKIF